MQCPAHLDKLRLKYESSLGVGVTIFATDYATRIIGSLPAQNISHHLSTIEPLPVRQQLLLLLQLPANPAAAAAAKSFTISADLLIQARDGGYDRIQSAPVNRVLGSEG